MRGMKRVREAKGVKRAKGFKGEEAGEGLQRMVGKDGWQGRSTRKDGKEKEA